MSGSEKKGTSSHISHIKMTDEKNSLWCARFGTIEEGIVCGSNQRMKKELGPSAPSHL